MTCRATRPAPGSLAAHDALVSAFVTWRLRQSASDLMWTNHQEADDAENARVALLSHAVDCGYTRASGDLIKWCARRINAYGRSAGVCRMEIDVTLGEHAERRP